MRVLLTGATGFIGAHVLAHLIEERCSVTALVVPETLSQLPHHDDVKVVLGGLDDRRTLAQATRDVDVVLHLAGKVSGESARDMIEVNVRGTGNLLAACAGTGVRRFVFVSSAAVYSPPLFSAQFPITEFSPLAPMGSVMFRTYGESKIEAERLVVGYHQTHGLEYSILRPTTAYGSGQGRTPQTIENFLERVLGKASLVLSGEAQRFNMQWVHVLDLASAIFRAGIAPTSRNQVFTIAGAELFGLPTLAAMMLDLLRPRSLIRFVRPSLNPTRYPYLMFDITKARNVLSYAPKIDLRTGLSQILEEMTQNGRLTSLFSKRKNAGYPA
jgi:nucleoside-diphosphate-sugar epimerase